MTVYYCYRGRREETNQDSGKLECHGCWYDVECTTLGSLRTHHLLKFDDESAMTLGSLIYGSTTTVLVKSRWRQPPPITYYWRMLSLSFFVGLIFLFKMTWPVTAPSS